MPGSVHREHGKNAINDVSTLILADVMEAVVSVPKSEG